MFLGRFAGALTRVLTHVIICMLTGVLPAACSNVNPAFDPKQPHHRANGFQNKHVLFKPKGLHWHDTGNTGYSADFTDIRAWLDQRPDAGRIDLALIPVGAYEPRWFMAQQHVNPAEAVQIHRDLRARHSVGVHWGTFELTDEALDAPPRDLAAALRAQGLSDQDFTVMAVGQTRQRLHRRAAVAQPLGNSAPR